MNILKVACLVLLIGALAGGTAYGDAKSGGSPLGGKLKDFKLTSIDGKEVSLKQFQGKKPVLLVFGSST